MCFFEAESSRNVTVATRSVYVQLTRQLAWNEKYCVCLCRLYTRIQQSTHQFPQTEAQFECWASWPAGRRPLAPAGLAIVCWVLDGKASFFQSKEFYFYANDDCELRQFLCVLVSGRVSCCLDTLRLLFPSSCLFNPVCFYQSPSLLKCIKKIGETENTVSQGRAVLLCLLLLLSVCAVCAWRLKTFLSPGHPAEERSRHWEPQAEVLFVVLFPLVRGFCWVLVVAAAHLDKETPSPVSYC